MRHRRRQPPQCPALANPAIRNRNLCLLSASACSLCVCARVYGPSIPICNCKVRSLCRLLNSRKGAIFMSYSTSHIDCSLGIVSVK
jgi:hypothetical protein